MTTPPMDVAAALTEAAKAVNAPRSVPETLEAIVRAARDSLPGFDHVGVSVSHRNGTIETLAGTDQLVWDLDALQYELGQGPCVDSIHEQAVVVVQELRHEQRWPQYVPRALRAGLQAQLGLRLYNEDETLGGLNLYSTSSEGVSDEAIQIAELFASHASIALGRSRHEHQLNEALLTRKTIGQAVGIVMERYQVDEDRAFHFLVRASTTSNVKLREVAQRLVEQGNRPAT